MIIIYEPVQLTEIQEKHNNFFDTMVKVVVDIEKELIALDAELYADLEELLLEQGSNQSNLWGANIYFKNPYNIEFTSLINIRPARGNKSMELQDKKARELIQKIVENLIKL